MLHWCLWVPNFMSFIEGEVSGFLDGQLPDSLKFSLDQNLLREDREMVSRLALNAFNVLRTKEPGAKVPVVWTLSKAVAKLRAHVNEFAELGLKRAPTELLEIATKQVVLELSERNFLNNMGFENGENSNGMIGLANVDKSCFAVKTWMVDGLSSYAAYLHDISRTEAVDTRVE